MKEMHDGGDSDAPEELTAAEGIKQDEEIRKVQRENVMRFSFVTHKQFLFTLFNYLFVGEKCALHYFF
uniref:Uncharacterized protein n=1 Tax=Musa acuminata subsp. malaccensis TaxID=214687 RepID=A0A804JWZ0_MUSAM